MADVPVPKEERDRVFRKLLAKADNRTCFDCPQRKPIWASSTFGVFICLDCAGGQRRLGTHLTFVRSVDMDTWTRGQLEAMKRGGNGRARDFFRAHGVRDLHIRQDTKYASSTARQYRDRLAKEVQQALQGGAAPSPLATPELPKKSFFEDFEPMEMPPRTQSSPALATPAASVKMPVPRAEPDAAQFRVRSAAQMKQARAASGKLSAAGLSAAGLSAAGLSAAGLRAPAPKPAPAMPPPPPRAPPPRAAAPPTPPPAAKPAAAPPSATTFSELGEEPAPAPAPAPVLRAPTQRRAPALGARRAGASRRGIGARKLTGAVDFSSPSPRQASPRLAGGKAPAAPKPGSPLDTSGGLYSGGSLWQQAPPPKRAPPPPPPPAADDDDDDDDDWYSDAPKKGGRAEAARRAEEAAAEGFDDADGFFDARSGSSRLAAAYAEASAAPAPAAPAPAPAKKKAPARAAAAAPAPAASTAARDRFGSKKGFGSDSFFDEPGAAAAPSAPSARDRALYHGGIGSDAFFGDGAPEEEDGIAGALSSAFSSLSRLG